MKELMKSASKKLDFCTKLFNLLIFQAIFLIFFIYFIVSRLYTGYNPYKSIEVENFNISRQVLVFFHIQKTSGREFDTFLIKNLVYYYQDMECPVFYRNRRSISKNNPKNCDYAKKKKKLFKWYWGRKTAGWPCGIHPHYRILKSCITRYYPLSDPEKDFFFFTMIREPIKRYLSEWHHASQGINWIGSKQKGHCLYDNYKKCFKGNRTWIYVELKEFINCKYNLGNNRQTLLLSDSSYECENKTDEKMLEEAKNNLKSMAFFGLTEYQNYTQQLFLKIFSKNFKLAKQFSQSNKTFADNFVKKSKQNKTDHIPYLNRIKQLNHLDIQLYAFGKDLFFKRLKSFGIIQ